MSSVAVVVATAGAALWLSGCVAAAVPVVAAGAIGKHRIDRADQRQVVRPTVPVEPLAMPATSAATAPTVPGGARYLYGSGEAAAQDLQTYIALGDFLIAKSSDKAVGHAVSSVVFAPGATIDHPAFENCGDKPLAVVLDIDETAILNLGFEGDQAARAGSYDQPRWELWERTGQGKVAPVPGVLDALEVARNAGIAVVFNSNRVTANADATIALLERAGFGKVVRGDTLWLADDAGAGTKDARRWAISARYCVVAMVGDQLGDFSDLFNAAGTAVPRRRELVGSRGIEIMWGRGWFMLPNPVYGTGVDGDFDAVFPLATRWSDPATAAPPIATGSSN